MPRYPSLACPGGVLRALDYGGTAVFAFTGAHTAAAHGLDLLGVLLVGTVTAVGGGTLRDLVVFARAPFWSGADGETEYLYISLASAALAFFALPELRRAGALHEEGPLLQWGDALGLGAFAVIGAQNGLRARLPPLLCLLCGVMTATFGGLTRDVLVAREGGVRILHSHAELYASCAGAGAGAYLAAAALRAPLWARVCLGVGAGAAARAAAWQQGLRLPTWSTLGGGAAELVLPARRTDSGGRVRP